MITRSQNRLATGIAETFRATKRKIPTAFEEPTAKRKALISVKIGTPLEELSGLGTLSDPTYGSVKQEVPTDAPACSDVAMATKALAADTAAIKPDPRVAFDYTTALAQLYRQDPRLKQIIEASGKPCRMFEETTEVDAVTGQRPRPRGLDAFKALCTAVVYQQLSGKAAASILKKFLLLWGEAAANPDWFPTPSQVRAIDGTTYRTAGLSVRKAEYLHAIADKFIDGSVSNHILQTLDDDEISKLLTSIRGIGQWTVSMFLMFDLRHPNILPCGDLGIRKGMSIYFSMKGTKKAGNKVYLPTPLEMTEAARIWEPWRSIASYYMWTVADTKTIGDS
ncbi:hypothetical protein HKX48_008447 [Thoreauomyces humboldtii]|nr:hypothetical protein HKX48_008447 [Thoreauomyces humboldtii]